MFFDSARLELVATEQQDSGVHKRRLTIESPGIRGERKGSNRLALAVVISPVAPKP